MRPAPCSSSTRPRVPPRTDAEQDAAALALTDTISAHDDRHVPDGARRAQARRARQARRRRDQDRLARHRRRGAARDADRRRQRPGQAHGLALPRPASAPQQPHLPRADDARARDAHVLDRARLRRGALPEAHGIGIRVERRAVLARVLRRPDRLPRAVAAVLQADGPGRRLRQDLRDRAGLPRRPVVHEPSRDRVHVASTPRSAGSTRTRMSRRCRRSCSPPRSPP